MRVTVMPGPIGGEVSILPSKSQLHRLLICAALARGETLLRCGHTQAEDIEATIACLRALGAEIRRREEGFGVTPIRRERLPACCNLPCGESGSTLRFLLPVVCALGVTGEFHQKGRLPERPLHPLDEELGRHGVTLSRPEPHILRCEGRLQPGAFSLPGNVSSQYVSGLLLALPLLEERSNLRVYGPVESEDYINMTLAALALFGVTPARAGPVYHISPNQNFQSPGVGFAEGDWSNGAFWLCAGAMPGGSVRCSGLHRESLQGDRAILNLLVELGAVVRWDGESILVSEERRRAVEIDAAAIPDLIPAIAAVAAVSGGETRIKNAARLRLKESDRISAIAQTLNALGAQVKEEPEGLRIQGTPELAGGTVDAWGDHRIAMMAAVASAACKGPVVINGAQAVRKSYPDFWRILASMGKTVIEEEAS